MTPEPVRALVAVVVVEETVEPKKNKPSKPAKHERTPQSTAPEDNGPIAAVGFGVTPSAEQPPPAEDEQGDADDQGRIGGGAEGNSAES